MTEMQAAGAVPELTLGWRMKMALDHARLSGGAMADYLDVSPATITRWMSDRGPVRRSTLLLWAMRTGVDRTWLETGEAPATGGGDEGLDVYASRDLNPEPAALEDSALTWADAA